MKNLLRSSLFFLIGLIIVLILNAYTVWLPGNQAIAQLPPLSQGVQQGINLYQAGKYTEAIAFFEQALKQTSDTNQRAIIHTNLATAYRQTGQLDAAIAQWEQAINIYKSQKDDASRRLIPELYTQQAQAYSNIGQNERAITLLQSALKITEKQPDPIVEIMAQGALGNAYRSAGYYEEALKAHEISLKVAQSVNKPEYITTAWNNLGNVYISRSERYQYQSQVAKSENDLTQEGKLNKLAEQDQATALNAYEQSLQISKNLSPIAEVKALLNINRLLEKSASSQQERIISNRERVLTLLAKLPDSRDKAFGLINLATQQIPALNSTSKPQNQLSAVEVPSSGVRLLENALTVARNVGDNRAESYSLGLLGQVYESTQQYAKAMDLTRQAQFTAQQANAASSLYRWQWQAGRILKATGKTPQAIASYEQAIATLQSIRGDIVAAGKELQFNFRDAVEPVYRELIGLLLERSALTDTQNKAQAGVEIKSSTINNALQTLELLKLAELQNYFGDECVQIAQSRASNSTKTLDPTAAVIYSVILNNRAAMILQLPDQSLKLYPIAMGSEELQQEIDKLRLLLEDRTTYEYIPQSQKIYDVLIRPLEIDLAAAKPKTLVFIQDGVLRKVPMAALSDGKQFLIEKYPIANVPSLSLTNYSPVKRGKLLSLSMGLSVERSPFAPLPNVTNEVTSVQNIMGGTKLIDQEFTLAQVEEKLEKESYSIIHMATHGKFGVDAASTFLVAYDQRIGIDEIDKALRSRQSKEPVELLTMSACQTAAGDNRSALGIAGVAVRAGVKSALASLWYISDEATVPLIEEFYTQLRQPNITKAEALQKAQKKLLADEDYNHPALWSPLILIGNWL